MFTLVLTSLQVVKHLGPPTMKRKTSSRIHIQVQLFSTLLGHLRTWSPFVSMAWMSTLQWLLVFLENHWQTHSTQYSTHLYWSTHSQDTINSLNTQYFFSVSLTIILKFCNALLPSGTQYVHFYSPVYVFSLQWEQNWLKMIKIKNILWLELLITSSIWVIFICNALMTLAGGRAPSQNINISVVAVVVLNFAVEINKDSSTRFRLDTNPLTPMNICFFSSVGMVTISIHFQVKCLLTSHRY